MRLGCWLLGHRTDGETRFIRRLDGYPLAAYGECLRCGKRTGLTTGSRTTRADQPPPFRADLAAQFAELDREERKP